MSHHKQETEDRWAAAKNAGIAAKEAADEYTCHYFVTADEYNAVLASRTKASAGIGAEGPKENYRYDKGCNGPSGPGYANKATAPSLADAGSGYTDEQAKVAADKIEPWPDHNRECEAAQRVKDVMKKFLEFPSPMHVRWLADAIEDYPPHWMRGRKRVL